MLCEQSGMDQTATRTIPIEKIEKLRRNQDWVLQYALDNKGITIRDVRAELGEEAKHYTLFCLHTRGMLEPRPATRNQGNIPQVYEITNVGRVALHASHFGVRPSYMPLLRRIQAGQDSFDFYSYADQNVIDRMCRRSLVRKLRLNEDDGRRVTLRLSTALLHAFAKHEPAGQASAPTL